MLLSWLNESFRVYIRVRACAHVRVRVQMRACVLVQCDHRIHKPAPHEVVFSSFWNNKRFCILLE